MLYRGLDVFFFAFHSGLIVFNLLGWAWKKTRRANLVLLLLTVFSWFVLGIWYGFGYCPCTDWHWEVRARLGHTETSPSYLVFLIRALTGAEVEKSLVDVFAVGFLFSALAASAFVNIRAILAARKAGSPAPP